MPTQDAASMNSITFGFSVCSLLVSIGTVIWNIRKDMADCGQLKVSASIRRIIDTGLSENMQDPVRYLLVSIVNIGRRPIRADKIVFVLNVRGAKNSDYATLTHYKPYNALPKLLEPHNSIEVTSTEYLWLMERYRDLKEVWVYDSTGKAWKAKSADVKYLQDQVKNLVEKNGGVVITDRGPEKPISLPRK